MSKIHQLSKAVVQPGISDVHIDRPLTDVSLAFLQEQDMFVADRVFPMIGVDKPSDQYFTYDRSYFYRDEMEQRAPATESAGGTYKISNDSYNTRVWAFHRDVPDQIRASADAAIQLDIEATQFLTHKALIRRERLWVENYFGTGVWGTDITGVSSSPTGPQVLQWDNAGATPIEDIRAGRRSVLAVTGIRPNVLVMGRAVYDALVDHPTIVGRLDRGQTTGPAVVMRDALAALFEVDEVLVMDSVFEAAQEGATSAIDFIGGKNCLLAHRPTSPGRLTPAAGYTFSWEGLLGAGALGTRVSRMRMDHLKADRIEIEQAFDQKLVSADLGYFWSSIVA
jgi:hypothetical protein